MGWVRGQARTSSKLDWSTVPRKVRDLPEGPVLGSRDNFHSERKPAESAASDPRWEPFRAVRRPPKPSRKALAKQQRMMAWENRARRGDGT